MKTKLVDQKTRPWAGKTYQHLYGRFEQHRCGLFFQFDLEDEHVEAIAGCFTSLPGQLQELAILHELTVDVSPFAGTRSSNTCTIYGNWSASGFKHVSPHLEVGRSAFGIDLSPYLAHELTHLWWSSLTADVKAQYQEFLDSSTSLDDKDVTSYAHEWRDEYLKALRKCRKKVSKLHSPGPTKWTFEKWVVESLCETVALLSFPSYKSDEDWTTTADLDARREAIRSIVCLEI